MEGVIGPAPCPAQPTRFRGWRHRAGMCAVAETDPTPLESILLDWTTCAGPVTSSDARERSPPQRYEHGDALAIAPVLVAEECDQVAFLQGNADEYVGRRDGGEEQVAGGHHGRRPECDDEAEIDRMPNELVQQGRLEARLDPSCRPTRLSRTWYRPNSSKWLIRNVLRKRSPSRAATARGAPSPGWARSPARPSPGSAAIARTAG